MIAVMLCLLVAGTASADTAAHKYTLKPAEINAEALLTITFGDRAKDAQMDDGEYPLYGVPGNNGRPFCGLDTTGGFGQLRFSSYPVVAYSQIPSTIRENIAASGAARCELTADEALQKSKAWLETIGITDVYLQSVTAFGKLEGYTGGYEIAYGQQLNGMPVYWAAATQRDERIKPQSNRIEITIGENGGLVSIDGYWSDFSPESGETEILSDVSAGTAFAVIGLEHGYDELCYLLTGTQAKAEAILAYRYQNHFISAADGTILQ